MPQVKAVLLNGPPRVGKDTGAEFLHQIVSDSPGFHNFTPYKIKFATPLKEMTHEVFDIDDVDEFYFEKTKHIPMEVFRGRTPREAYIYVDKMLKEKFGDDYLGKLMADRMEEAAEQIKNDVFFASDCGFNKEVVPLIERFGVKNLLIVRLFRKGCTFKGDSRGYVDVPGVPIQKIENVDGKLDMYKDDLENVIKSWLYH